MLTINTYKSDKVRITTAAFAAAAMLVSAAPTLATATINTLITFGGSTGEEPSNIVMDSAGNIYGITTKGGNTSVNSGSGYGTIYEWPVGGGPEKILATFTGPNGTYPVSSIYRDATGNIFGATEGDTGANDGTVFELPAGSNTIVTRAAFNGANGSGPFQGVVADAAGNLYGTTQSSTSGNGTVFEIPVGTHTINTVATFTSASLVQSVVVDKAGNIYGSTYNGGTNSNGTVFKIPAGGGIPIQLASFNFQSNGSTPHEIIVDSAGDVFGERLNYVPPNSPSVSDSIFEIPANSGTVKTLVNFNAVNTYPGSLILDGAGNLYGLTSEGGANSDGTIFRIPAGGGSVSTLATFDYAHGTNLNDIIVDPSGNIFGTANIGGNSNYLNGYGAGTLFELTGTGFVVPEPASLSLLALAGAGLLTRRSRRTNP